MIYNLCLAATSGGHGNYYGSKREGEVKQYKDLKKSTQAGRRVL